MFTRDTFNLIHDAVSSRGFHRRFRLDFLGFDGDFKPDFVQLGNFAFPPSLLRLFRLFLDHRVSLGFISPSRLSRSSSYFSTRMFSRGNYAFALNDHQTIATDNASAPLH